MKESQETKVLKWTRYKNEFLASLRSTETFRAYRGEIEGFLSFFFADSYSPKLDAVQRIESELSASAIEYILSVKKVDPSSKRIVNTRTLNRRRAALTSFFKYLFGRGYLASVPALLSPFVVSKRSSTPSPTSDECLRLLAFLEGYRKIGLKEYRNTLFFLFLFLLALRKSEALHIRWSDIDPYKKTLSLIQKGGSVKVLPIPDSLFSLLLEYQALVFPRVSSFWSDWKESGFVFPSLVGRERKALSSSAGYAVVCSVVKQAFDSSSLSPHYTPHSFRKAFIEESLNRKVDLISIANATGHSSIEMVKYYDTRDTLTNNAIHDLASILDWQTKDFFRE